MTILEIIAPTNSTLTAKLFEKGQDTVIETINLTERANAKGIYYGTVTETVSGLYNVVVFENDESIQVNNAFFNGDDVVYASSLSPMVQDIYDRIVFTVPDEPVIPIPAPTSDITTRVYSYCYNTHGRPAAGIPITIKLMESATTPRKGSFLSDEFTFVSDANGVATTEIPRGTQFKFRVKSGKNGDWIEFRGVDAETYQLPFLVNK